MTAQMIEIHPWVVTDLQSWMVVCVPPINHHVVANGDCRVKGPLLRNCQVPPVVVDELWPVVVMKTQRMDLSCSVTEQSTALDVTPKHYQGVRFFVVDGGVADQSFWGVSAPFDNHHLPGFRFRCIDAINVITGHPVFRLATNQVEPGINSRERVARDRMRHHTAVPSRQHPGFRCGVIEPQFTAMRPVC